MTPEAQPESVYVWGLRQREIGRAASASQGTVFYGRFTDRPILRPGEVAEVVPGLVVTQHSGSGKANQFFLRGFNLDHGTDFSVSFNGVPLNLRSHAHGQGYLDLNTITPELLERIDYRKGTYYADVGDFSAAGSVAFNSFGAAPDSFAEIRTGAYNYYRLLGVQSISDGSYIAADLTADDGPWRTPERLRKMNLYGQFAVGTWTVTALAYANEWTATDQIPKRAVDAGTLPRFGTIDPTDGGRTSRYIVTARNTTQTAWDTVLYVQKYDLKLWSNFTYFLDNPIQGDQFEQADDRWIGGGSVSKTWMTSSPWQFSAGADFRDDLIGGVGLYQTQARNRIGTVRSDRVNQYSGALWAQGTAEYGSIRTTLGARLEGMGANVTSANPLNSGAATDAIFAPKASVAWRAASNLEFYANVGRGYHSNDARGATARVEPLSGMPVDRVNLLAPATGGELGVRYEGETARLSLAAFWLKLDSELVYVGDAGVTEASSGSRRFGGEASLTWRPISRIEIDISGAATNARYAGNPVGGNRIPNAIGFMLSGGISALITDDLTATMTIRSIGPAPLIEDGSQMSKQSTLANFLLRYRMGRYTITGEILNLFDSKANDIQYFYASRLPGEPADGVEDDHFHPAVPRIWRLGLRVAL